MMNNIQARESNRVRDQDVITSRDYELCPTIKSDSDAYAMIVVKSDGNSQSIKAGSLHRGVDLRSLENSALGSIAR